MTKPVNEIEANDLNPNLGAQIGAQTKGENDNRALNIRRIGLLILLLAVAVIGYFIYHYVKTQSTRFVKTENAYAAVELTQITPKTSGTIRLLNVRDTQSVQAGDLIAKLEDADQILRVQEAEAQLQLALRKFSGALASDAQFEAQIYARDADIKSAEAKLSAAMIDVEKARTILTRRQNLIAAGAVSGDELTNAKHAYDSAIANLALIRANIAGAQANKKAAIGTRTTNSANFAGTNSQTNPEIMLARTRLQQARNALDDTSIYAPISGVIANRKVQIGQRISAGMTMMEIVPLEEIYIDANFKEVQLRNVKLGQEAEVTSDLYGEKVKYHGRVAGFSGGTGAAFALIPAQNASGNWIKVVQRLPVRIELDAADLKAHPLKLGLSMHVSIDTRPEDKKTKR